jgi:hypothetical protein
MLKLNDDKTEVIQIGTSHTLSKSCTFTLQIGDAAISPAAVVRNLGGRMDCHMKMDRHVAELCRSAYYHLHNIRKVRHYVTTEVAEMLVHAFVTSRLDQNNALLYGISEGLLDKLQRVQNMAARVVTRSGKYCSATSLLKALHWLPVRYRIQYKILLLTYKCLNELAPTYLTELVSVNTPTRTLRSSSQLLLQVPRTRLVTAGDRTFAKAAPTLWNSLPDDLQRAPTVLSFKRKLKTVLCSRAYGADD